MSELTIRLLGMAELALDGRRIHLKRRHSLALLAYLVLSGRSHSRDELAAFLAGDIPNESARKLVRNSLADLSERGLGPFLTVSRQAISFNSTMPYTIDIAALDDLLLNDTVFDSAMLTWAREVCGQELLAGLALRDAPFFEEWLVREREHARQKLIRIVDGLLVHCLRTGELAAGIDLSKCMLEVEPWHEGFHRHLMRLLAHDGQLGVALAQYNRCRIELQRELGVEPQLETTALYDRLRAGPIRPRHNLPPLLAGLDTVIGRDSEVAAVIRHLIDPECRLLTITGLGGSGKSALASLVAAQLAAPAPPTEGHPFPDGIFLVTPLESAKSVVGDVTDKVATRPLATAIGFSLGMAFYGNIDRLDQVIAHLSRKRVLLILDNLDLGGSLLDPLREILRRAPGITILVTARTRLGFAEEWVQELGGLARPERIDDVDRAPASQLVLRAALRSGASIGPEDYPHIVEICRLTGGLPLALKNVAAWLNMLSCAEIAFELRQARLFVIDPLPNLEDSRVSLSAIIESTWHRLPVNEQQALRRLATFPARFDLRAAEAVGVEHASLLALCERSLVEHDATKGFRLHPLVRVYASEQLARCPDEEADVRQLHATYFAALMSRQTKTLFQSPEPQRLLGAERANLRAAWDWAVEHLDCTLLTQMLECLAVWHTLSGRQREWWDILEYGIARFQAALIETDDPTLRTMLARLQLAGALVWRSQDELDRASLLLDDARKHLTPNGPLSLRASIDLYSGLIRNSHGDTDSGMLLLQRARALATQANDPKLKADSVLALSFAEAHTGNFTMSKSTLRRAMRLYQSFGNRLNLSRAYLHQGRLQITTGDFTRARASLEQSLHLGATFGDRTAELWSNAHLGMVLDIGFGDHLDAGERFAQGLRVAEDTNDLLGRAFCLWASGRNALHIGDLQGAESCFNQALVIARDANSPAVQLRAFHGLGRLAYAAGDSATAEEWASQALAFAVDSGRPNERVSTLFLLGQACELQERVSAAGAAYTEARELARDLSLPYLYCDTTAGLASLALTAGHTMQATFYAHELFEYLQDHALAGCDEPGWVALICYQAFQITGDNRAGAALQGGSSILEHRRALLPEPQRRRYIDAFPARRHLMLRRLEQQVTDLHGFLPTTLVPTEIFSTQQAKPWHGASS